jgi:hypothetical protein
MAKTSPPNEAFERFRKFAKQVISVPKAEIDRRAEEYRKSRKALRKAKA